MATPYGFTPLGFVNVTGISTSSAGLGVVPGGSIMALIACEIGNVRWRDDGVLPTTTVGMLLSSGQEFQYAGNLAGIKFISIATSVSPSLDISFYK